MDHGSLYAAKRLSGDSLLVLLWDCEPVLVGLRQCCHISCHNEFSCDMSCIEGVLSWKLTHEGNMFGDSVVFSGSVKKRVHIDVDVEVLLIEYIFCSSTGSRALWKSEVSVRASSCTSSIILLPMHQLWCIGSPTILQVVQIKIFH